MVSNEMFSSKDVRRMISVQASSGSDRYGLNVPPLQEEIFAILVRCHIV